MNVKLSIVICLILTTALAFGCKRNADDQMHGTAAGAGLGAITGLALGALAGDAAMGAAVGAVAGASSGTAYEYDSRRQDRRNKELATAISSNQQVAQAAPQNETVAQSGTRHLEDFLGEWNISAWAMNGDGSKINGTGKAKVVMESKESAKFTMTDLKAEGNDKTFEGSAALAYSDKNGFSLSCSSSAYSGTRTYVGEYLPQENTYNFFPVDAASTTGSTGVIRSNVKVEARATGNMLSINTYSMIDGKETQIQSYRFTK